MRKRKPVSLAEMAGTREAIQTSYVSARIYETFPFEDTRATGATMDPDQFRMALAITEIEPRELCELFWLRRSAVKRFADGRVPVPRGIADWLRLKVAARVRAMAIATGTPIATSDDFAPPPGEEAASIVSSMVATFARKRTQVTTLEARGLSREEIAALRHETQKGLAEIVNDGAQDGDGIRHVISEFEP